MTATKISLSEVLKSQRYAIKIVNIKQILALIPDCNVLEDMEFFFSTDPFHTEYLGTIHTVDKGFHLGFVHRENKELLNFEDLDLY